MIFPGDPIRLQEDVRKRLGLGLAEMVEELEAQYADMFRQIERDWRAYEAEPQEAVKSEPWPDASNVVVPIIRTASDAIVSRYFNAIHATDKTWVGTTQNEDFQEFVTPIVDFLNWASRNEFDLRSSTLGWITEMVVLGSSVLGLTWEDQVRQIYVPGSGPRPKPQRVTLRRGPTIRHIPREFILWDTAYRVAQAPAVVRQSLLTWSDLSLLMQESDIDLSDEDLAKVRSTPISETGSNAVGIFYEKHRLEGSEAQSSPLKLYDVRECWVSPPALAGRGVEIVDPEEADPDQARIPILAWVHQTTGIVLSVRSKPYFLPDWPFYDAYFRQRPSRGSGAGLGHMLNHIQRAVATMTNQSIDSVTLSNSIVAATTDPRLAKQKLEMNKLLLIDSVDSLIPIKFPKDVIPDINLINLLTNMGERLSGISDPLLGRETRMGGHPSPATSTIALLQEANKLFALGIRSLREELTRLGKDIATLYQQFELDKDGRLARVVGPGDARRLQEFIFPTDLPIFGNLELDLQAISESMNPETERNRALLVFQVTHNFFTIVMQYMSIAQNPQAPPQLREVATKAVSGLSSTFQRILEASDVDDLDAFLFELRQNNLGAQALGQFANAGGGPGGGAGAVPGAALGGGPGLPPEGPGSGL